jgi:phospholipase/lecithinase/hemolysin
MRANKLAYFCTLYLILLIPGIGTGPAFAGDGFSAVFIFGDSLSDSGNVYALTGQTSKAPYAVIPSYPYAIGGHHFSNGKTWAEGFSQGLQLNNGGKPSMSKPGKNGNYAFGGARARANSGSAAPDSGLQINMFLGDYGAAPSDALYVIQFGGNDVRDALLNPAEGINILQGAISAVASDIQTLYFAGARNFMVANSPNLAHAPVIKMIDTDGSVIAGAALLSGFYNGFLDGALQQLEALPGIKIYRLDMGAFIDDVVENPGDYGLTNVASPCLNFISDSDAKCDNPEEYLFWDGIHPTAAGHNALAEVALGVISGN